MTWTAPVPNTTPRATRLNMRMSRQLAISAAFLTSITAIAGCSNDPNQATPAQTPLPVVTDKDTTRTQITIEAAPEIARQQLESTTPNAQAIITSTAGALGLRPIESACLAQRLDANPTLRDSLGENPITSPRYNELAALSQDCIRVTTNAISFANGIAEQAGGTLPAEALNCLREHYATLTPEENAAIVQAGLNPSTSNPTPRAAVDNILDTCNIDRSQLSHP